MSILNKELTLNDYPTVNLQDLVASHVAKYFMVDQSNSHVSKLPNAQTKELVPQVELLLVGKENTIAEGIKIVVWMNIDDEFVSISKDQLTAEMIINGGFSTSIDGVTWEEYQVVDHGVLALESTDPTFDLISEMRLDELSVKMIQESE